MKPSFNAVVICGCIVITVLYALYVGYQLVFVYSWK